ncbi:MAG TPA: hypothetical protein VGD65_18780 [Chryseosolibacter sp.]
MFPLTLLPLPGELVPLHIFEPRYRELLTDCETTDMSFGIYCNHELNTLKIGSLMKLESVIKRYPSGESDIIVRCTDTFFLDKLYRTFPPKKYPGGDVRLNNVNLSQIPSIELYELFLIYQSRRNLKNYASVSTYQIAQDLSLDLLERYKFLTSSAGKQQAFLINQLKFQMHILLQEEKSRDVFHLN